MSGNAPPDTPDAGAAPTPGQTDDGSLELRVKSQRGDEVLFKVRPSTKLGKLMTAYCDQVGCDKRRTRFMFDGNRVVAEDTTLKLGMEDGDIIDAMCEMVGGTGDIRT